MIRRRDLHVADHRRCVRPSAHRLRRRGDHRRQLLDPLIDSCCPGRRSRPRRPHRREARPLREVHRQRLADRRHGGRRRGHERLVRVRGAQHRRGRADLRLRPREPGRSDPAAGPRELSDLVGDFEALLRAAKIPGPTSSSAPRAAATSPPATRTSTPTRSPALSSSKFPRRSATRLGRSSRRPTRRTLPTSNAVTTFRSRRTPGRLASGSATSL